MAGVVMFVLFLALGLLALPTQTTAVDAGPDDPIGQNAQQMLADGRQIFRYDTFGVSHPPAASATVNIYTATIKKEKHI
jgi:hypothetical protein